MRGSSSLRPPLSAVSSYSGVAKDSKSSRSSGPGSATGHSLTLPHARIVAHRTRTHHSLRPAQHNCDGTEGTRPAPLRAATSHPEARLESVQLGPEDRGELLSE